MFAFARGRLHMLLSRRTAIAVLTAISLALARPASAQVISGRVILPDSTPIPGVIVLATNDSGRTLARTLTTDRGRFTLRLPSAGRYGLRLLRIGFRPLTGPSVTVAADAKDSLQVVYAAEPVRLAAMSVHEPSTCRVNVDTGLAVARVWEEARKAMLASELTTGAVPLVAEWITYDRVLDSTARIVRRQQVRTEHNPTTHAFRSAPVSDLDTAGYVVERDGVTHFFAPDADVLLSDEFVRDHCYHIVEGPTPASIGLSFDPTRGRRDMHEIEGTLWLDRVTAELRSLDFHYTNLAQSAMQAGAGGRVEFLRLDDGTWLVSRWVVRMPLLGQPSQVTANGMGRVFRSEPTMIVRAVQMTGGEVTRVSRNDTVVYGATGARIAVIAVPRDTLVSPAQATLALDGTDYLAVGDSSGRMVLQPVLAGRYHAVLRTPLMDSLAVPSVERELETRAPGDDHVDTIPLPTAGELLTQACPRDSVRHGEGMLRGTVRNAHGRGVANAAVTVSWQADFSKAGLDNRAVSWNDRRIGTLTDGAGSWRLCGVPRQVPLEVRVQSDSGAAAGSARLAEDVPFGAVDLEIGTRESGISTRDSLPSARPLTESRFPIADSRVPTLIELIVTDSHAAILPDVRLDVSVAGAPTRTFTTGASGRALIPDATPGVVSVEARRIGFTPGRIAAVVQAGRNTMPIVMHEAEVPTLDTVRVIGDQRVFGLRRNDEFEMRRINHQATVSITRADIEKRHPVSLWQMLQGIPSIRVVDLDTTVVVMSTREMVTSIFDQGPCYLAVMVDGIMKYDSKGVYDLRQLPAPTDVHGVEVFAGPSSIPLQYGGVGDRKWCGMVAIWTR